jgi:hypothetical protein
MSAEEASPSPGASDRGEEPGDVHPPVPETVPRIGPGGVGPPTAPPSDLRSKRTVRAGILAVCAVVLVVGGGVTAAIVTGHSSSQSPPKPSAVASESFTQRLTSVPGSVFESVGLPAEITNLPFKVTGRDALTDPGLPELLWIGAEYCPFCASERWSLVMALSRFGKVTGLGTSYSSPSDFAPDTPTLDFSKVSYSSPYLVFEHYELASNRPASPSAGCNVNGYACLQVPPNSDLQLFETLGEGDFPFVDFGNKVVQSGAGFEDQPLVLAGLSFDQIARLVYEPGSGVAQAEDGSANYFTAAICIMTGGNPTSVCSSPVVKQAEAKENVNRTG